MLADAPALPDAPAVDAPPIATDARVPTFAEIYVTIIEPRCVSCHGGEERSSRLTMGNAEVAYDSLIDVPVESDWIASCAVERRWTFTPYRVRPGDTTSSMLAWLPECYVRDAGHGTLTALEADTLRAWIAGGAPEDDFR